MQGVSKFRVRVHVHVRVVDGVGGGTPFTALLLALLGAEMTLAREVGGMEVVTTAKTLDLLPRTLGGGFDVPAGLMGADEVTVALCANPLASAGMVLEIFEIGLGSLGVVDVDQGGEKGEPHRREAGAIRSGHIYDAHFR